MASHAVPVAIVEAQARAVLDDIGADAIKIGMLGDAAMVEAVAAPARRLPGYSAVIDPVMIAKGGQPLLAEAAIEGARGLCSSRARRC